VPEEKLLDFVAQGTLWHKGKLTEADTPTILLGTTPSD